MAKNTSTVNISFRKDLLEQIDSIAAEESRSRSELIREAARMYIQRRRRWDAIFASASEAARARGLTESDVEAEIQAHRSDSA